MDTSDLSVTFPNWKKSLDSQVGPRRKTLMKSQGPAANTSEAIFSPFEFTTLAETLVASGESLALGRTDR